MGQRLMLLNRLLALLEKRGMKFTPEKTLQEQMAEARQQFDLPADRLQVLTDLQYRWRWGRLEPSTEDIQQAREHFDALCEHLSRREQQDIRNPN